MKPKPKKKKLSGAQYKNLRRARALKDPKVRAVEVLKMPYIGRLKTLNDWRMQVARLYRRTAKGELPAEIATKLTYIANVGATLAKEAQTVRKLEELQQQLAQIGYPVSAGVITSSRRVTESTVALLEHEGVDK